MDLNAQLTHDGNHLGDALFWNVSDVDLDRQALETLFDQYGLDKALLPDPVERMTAFRRAIEVMKRRKHVLAAGTDGLVRFIKEDATAILHAIVQEKKVDCTGQGVVAVMRGALLDKTLEHAVIDRVAFSKTTGTVLSDNNSGAAQAIMKLTDRQTLGHTDIQEMLQRAMRQWQAFAIRPSGGVYFVPAQHGAQVKALQAVVGSVGNCTVGVLNLYSTAATTSSLTASAKVSLEEELNQLKKELTEFDSKTRASTFERRVQALNTLKDKVALYAEILGFARDGLVEGINAAEENVRGMLVEKLAGG